MKWVVVGIIFIMVSFSADAQGQEPKHVRGFGIALVLGEAQGAAAPEGLSAGGRKALADVKDFLPYKGYRVLDTQFVAGDENSNVVVVRLHGLENQEYDFTLQPRAGAYSVNMKTAVADAFARTQAVVQPPGGQVTVPTIGGQTILSTRFDMTAGETVVVGTSRVQGDKALIVLLTAVPR